MKKNEELWNGIKRTNVHCKSLKEKKRKGKKASLNKMVENFPNLGRVVHKDYLELYILI